MWNEADIQNLYQWAVWVQETVSKLNDEDWGKLDIAVRPFSSCFENFSSFLQTSFKFLFDRMGDGIISCITSCHAQFNVNELSAK